MQKNGKSRVTALCCFPSPAIPVVPGSEETHWTQSHDSPLTIVASPVQRRVALVVLERTVFLRQGHLQQLAQPRGVAAGRRVVQGGPPSGIFAENRDLFLQQHLHTFLMTRHDLINCHRKHKTKVRRAASRLGM